jgi:hypothetical protein
LVNACPAATGVEDNGLGFETRFAARLGTRERPWLTLSGAAEDRSGGENCPGGWANVVASLDRIPCMTWGSVRGREIRETNVSLGGPILSEGGADGGADTPIQYRAARTHTTSATPDMIGRRNLAIQERPRTRHVRGSTPALRILDPPGRTLSEVPLRSRPPASCSFDRVDSCIKLLRVPGSVCCGSEVQVLSSATASASGSPAGPRPARQRGRRDGTLGRHPRDRPRRIWGWSD